MKKELLWIDLAACSVWALNILCGHNYWNQLTTLYVILLVHMRLISVFALARYEKKAWIPLVVSAVLWAFQTLMGVYIGIGKVGEYFFHVTGLEYNKGVDLCLTGAFWLWIVFFPIVYYLILYSQHRLVDSDITTKELYALLWHERKARYYMAMMGVSFLVILAGLYTEHRFCQAMCFVSPALLYGLICRYYRMNVERIWLIIAGSVCFWYAQMFGGVFRVAVLVVSFVLIAYACALLYKKTKCHLLAACALFAVGIFFPSCSIGYNQYTCINYPRYGYHHLASYSGILYVSDDFNGSHIGLRDRYGLLINPEYDIIRPVNPNRWGWFGTFMLEKGDQTYIYDICKNLIAPFGKKGKCS